jgi:DNA-binding transcriptional MerR regulator
VKAAREVNAARHTAKSATAFRTIGEVAQELDVPAHVLRFWESKFPQVKPIKRGGRRYYRPEDCDLLLRIRRHLYQEGYTIRGVQKLLGEDARGCDASPSVARARPKAIAAHSAETDGGPNPSSAELRRALKEARAELLEIRTLLDKLLAR